MNTSRAWFEKDFYKVLGVGENASPDEIKRAYKKLARQHHPDRNPGNAAAEERMKEISEAHDVLSDPKKRQDYDNVRRMARSGGGFAGGFPSGGWSTTASAEDLGFDLGDLFGDIFGGRGARRGRGRAQRGPDLETTVRLSFEQAAHGATVPVRVRRDAPCGTCKGTGDASGAAATCSTCGGAGMTQESQGMFSFARPCATCHGTGRVVTTPCRTCGGAGVQAREDEVRVKIPAGIADGARIRVRGRGGAAMGAATGDLYVVVSVDEHPVFRRSGNDLLVEVPVSFPQLALGTTVSVPTLTEPVTLRIPAGTQPGRTFRVRGRGVAKARAAAGDLLATVRVVVPTSLSAEERELFERLRALEDSAQGPRTTAAASDRAAG